MAGPWEDQKIEVISQVAMGATNITSPFSDWADFVTKFNQQFSNPNPEQTAQHKLSLLRQGSKTAKEFVTDFMVYVLKSGYNDTALIGIFKR